MIDDEFPGWSDDEPLDHLLEFVAAGSRVHYDYFPMSEIKTSLGHGLQIAPVIGAVRYSDKHEFILGLRMTHIDCEQRIQGKCLLEFDELVAFIKLLESWLNAVYVERPTDAPRVRAFHYETQHGLVLETQPSRLGEVARLSVASLQTLMLDGANLEELLRACQSVKVFLDGYRS